MLIRWATKEDISILKARNLMIPGPTLEFAIERYEAAVAIDRRTGACLGMVMFSRKSKEITFLQADTPAAEEKLLLVARRQTHPQGGSFHYRYPQWSREAQAAFCPACNAEPTPEGLMDIAEMEHSWATAEYPGQGRLFGKMHVLAKRHTVHFEDMPADEMAAFMEEVRQVGRALRKVTGAVKINYELHANSGPHLHIHLFPRYLDDGFPSAPIDYRKTTPAPYEDYDEFLWFVRCMGEELKSLLFDQKEAVARLAGAQL